jgi:hypothetical protein
LDVSNERELFLIDTGANISLVKGEKLIETTEFDPRQKVKVKCVDGSPSETHGVVETKIIIGNNEIPHSLLLVSKQVDLPCDGILGRDFFQIAKATICYASRTVTLRGEQYPIVCKGQKRNQIKLPPRSESVVKVPVKPGSPRIGVSDKCKLLDGIFMAASKSRVKQKEEEDEREGYSIL